MIPVTIFAGRDVAVLGLGLSGLASARALKAGGANPVLWDDNGSARDEAARQGFTLSDLAAADWSRFAALVLAPGIPLTHPKPHWSVSRAKEAGVEVIGDIELFFRKRARTSAPGKVVVITGTNGKSTTTALTAHLLSAAGKRVALGGNIGKAVLDLDPFAPDLTYVLEL
ncbi:MAG TPA: Mur ligase family protein, partial [Methyloceanibacter sp.]|nr:Mur ligase family protein [Methyloceanibacter sp.]